MVLSIRTAHDIINRKEANQRYYKLEKNKKQKRSYQLQYDKCLKGPDKMANSTILKLHEEWAIKNGYRPILNEEAGE